MPEVSGSRARKRPLSKDVNVLVMVILVVAVLYFGKPVVVPLALAVLLAFILTPLVVMVQRQLRNRVASVLLVVLLTFAAFGLLGWSAGVQINKLARDMPAHAVEIKAKINSIRNSGGRVSKMFGAFTGSSKDEQTSEENKSAEKVVVAPPQDTANEKLANAAATVLEPVASAALVFILVIFMLIKREDLRNRVISLLGHTRLTGTTRVLVESAERISRLLLMQLMINAGFGVLFGASLLLIGVPYALLWGFLALVLRFIPFIGAWMAVALPMLLSFAIFPGMTQVFLVLGVFLVLELVTGNVLEPLLFGHSTGVSPVALLIAAVFWTWVWGPIGLVLSTPLTVCLVVLGQHVPRLRFLMLLLGDQPALDRHVAYYQRLLAGDRDEALLIARALAVAEGLERVPDDVMVPALRMTRRDREAAGLTAEDEKFIYDATRDVLASLAPSTGDPAVHARASSPLPLVLGCAAHHYAEELALLMVQLVSGGECQLRLLSTRVLPTEIEAQIERDKPAVLYVAVMPPGGLSQCRYLCRRLHRKFPDLKIVVGYFGKTRDFDALLVKLRSSGASNVATSVLQSRNQIRTMLPSGGVAPAPDAPLGPDSAALDAAAARPLLGMDGASLA